MAKEKKGSFDWRLEKFVHTLTESLEELKKQNTNQPKHSDLISYTVRVEFLNGLLNSDKLETTSLKSLALSNLAPAKKTKEEERDNTEAGGGGRVVRRFQKDSMGQQLLLETRSRLHGELREELIGKKKDTQRDAKGQEDRHAEIVKEEERLQDRLTEDMALLARSLKENANLAGRIVKGDNERLDKLATDADANYLNLKRENERMEKVLGGFCDCWLWLSLLLVAVTFICMVLFMRMFTKS